MKDRKPFIPKKNGNIASNDSQHYDLSFNDILLIFVCLILVIIYVQVRKTLEDIPDDFEL